MSRFAIVNVLFATVCSVIAAQCAAQENFIGAWDIVKIEKAPWLARRPELKPYAERALRHARITFQPDRVTAPIWIACKKPHYEMLSLDFDALFEGGLSDPDHGLNTPQQLAQKLGFTKKPVPSMLTGCSELLFHLVDSDTAMFALNNVLYTMKRHGK